MDRQIKMYRWKEFDRQIDREIDRQGEQELQSQQQVNTNREHTSKTKPKRTTQLNSLP